MPVELLLRPDLGNKPYRLRMRFRVPAGPDHPWLKDLWRQTLDRAKYAAGEQFVADMAKRGWEYIEQYGLRMTGPYVAIDPMPRQKPPRRLSAREMLPGVMRGERFLPEPFVGPRNLPALAHSDSWEYELVGVFLHKTIVFEYPYPHEEQEELRNR